MSKTGTAAGGVRPPSTGREAGIPPPPFSVGDSPPVERIDTTVYRVPTDRPEADGTITWNSTTLVLVEVSAGGATGIGFTYASGGAATVVRDTLADVVRGRSSMATGASWAAMQAAVRNVGRPGVAASAISAVDVALWDLKARLLGVSLAALLGPVRGDVPVYGSGGFTSYSEAELREQLSGWVELGITRVKMKVGADPAADVRRVHTAREAIGGDAELFVDANGAYAAAEALWFAERFAESRVSWFEEPVPSDELESLRVLRDRAPAGMAIAAGEYGTDAFYFRRMLEAGAVHVLQADATRCGGITGFFRAAALCEGYGIELSAHTAPVIHLAPAAAISSLRHVEYFHDHARIERMLFDGVVEPRNGALTPAWDRAGLGVQLRREDAEQYRVG